MLQGEGLQPNTESSTLTIEPVVVVEPAPTTPPTPDHTSGNETKPLDLNNNPDTNSKDKDEPLPRPQLNEGDAGLTAEELQNIEEVHIDGKANLIKMNFEPNKNGSPDITTGEGEKTFSYREILQKCKKPDDTPLYDEVAINAIFEELEEKGEVSFVHHINEDGSREFTKLVLDKTDNTVSSNFFVEELDAQTEEQPETSEVQIETQPEPESPLSETKEVVVKTKSEYLKTILSMFSESANQVTEAPKTTTEEIILSPALIKHNETSAAENGISLQLEVQAHSQVQTEITTEQPSPVEQYSFIEQHTAVEQHVAVDQQPVIEQSVAKEESAPAEESSYIYERPSAEHATVQEQTPQYLKRPSFQEQLAQVVPQEYVMAVVPAEVPVEIQAQKTEQVSVSQVTGEASVPKTTAAQEISKEKQAVQQVYQALRSFKEQPKQEVSEQARSAVSESPMATTKSVEHEAKPQVENQVTETSSVVTSSSVETPSSARTSEVVEIPQIKETAIEVSKPVIEKQQTIEEQKSVAQTQEPVAEKTVIRQTESKPEQIKEPIRAPIAEPVQEQAPSQTLNNKEQREPEQASQPENVIEHTEDFNPESFTAPDRSYIYEQSSASREPISIDRDNNRAENIRFASPAQPETARSSNELDLNREALNRNSSRAVQSEEDERQDNTRNNRQRSPETFTGISLAA